MDGEHTDGALADPPERLRLVAGEAIRLRVRLLTGDVHHLALGTRTGSIGNALDRLEDWIETEEGSWIQKRWIVEASVVRGAGP
ncbi:MAG: hypothetical protein FJW96_17815 [Actinobacteria bacterium]|nr:hypothetical protein [Actinomycetota bacterium]